MNQSDNSAGKSTLIKILTSVHQHDSGGLRIEDEPTRLSSPRAVLDHGIGTVYQDFRLIPLTSMWYNLVLGLEPTTGLAKSRCAGGRRPGKVSALNADQRRELLSDHESGDYSIRDLMRKYPLGRSAIYSLINRERNGGSTPATTPSAERRDATT